MTFCKVLNVFCFLFANTLHLKYIISLQSVIGHRIEKSSPCHRDRERIRTWKIELRSSLLTLGKIHASMTLPSLTRSLKVAA